MQPRLIENKDGTENRIKYISIYIFFTQATFILARNLIKILEEKWKRETQIDRNE